MWYWILDRKYSHSCFVLSSWLFSRHRNLLLIYPLPIWQMYVFFVTKTTLYDRPHSYWTRVISLCFGRKQWRQDENCCVCTAPPRLLRFTRGPLRITSECSQVVHLSHLCSFKLQPFILPNATKNQGMGIKLSLVFLGTLTRKQQWTPKSGDTFCRWTMSNWPCLLNNRD